MSAPAWIGDHDELVAFGRAIAIGSDWTVSDVFAYLEKPWKWDEEHTAWIRAGRPETLLPGDGGDA